MKAIILPISALALIGASENGADKSDAVKDVERAHPLPVPSPDECSDRITKAREEAGLPLLKREPASPEKPLMIYAVDRREHGCSVMVMKGNPDDIRQLPERMEGPPIMIPAKVAEE